MLDRRSLLRVGLGAGLAMTPSSLYAREILREVNRFSFPSVVTRIVPGWAGDLTGICDTLNRRLFVRSESRGNIFSIEALSGNDSICFTRDDRYLITPHRVSSSETTVFEIYDPNAGLLVNAVEGNLPGRRNAARCLRATPDGRYLVVLQDSGKQLALYNMRWEIVARVPTGLRGASGMAISANGSEIAISSVRRLQFRTIPDLSLIRDCEEVHSGTISALTYISADAVLFGTDRPSLQSNSDPSEEVKRQSRFVGIISQSCIITKQFGTPYEAVRAVAYLDRAGLVCALFNRHLQIWHKTGEFVRSLAADTGVTMSLALLSSGNHLMMADGNSVRLFSVVQ